ncbi:NeuD/PglB/VioB family sugar acetyltransferase [Wolinella succinogenes]|uniref:NeuD/PglB/VioB family sugar acetyltransferase n=1 Tax=Wolinella succinogenes TaxID=844 RepID=UPI002FCC2409
MEKVVIYGNGKIAKIVYQFIKKQFDVVAFTVDNKFIEENKIEGLPLISFEDIQNKYNPIEYKMLIAVGYVKMNSIREEKYNEAKAKGYSFINYIHPSVETHDNVKIGENNVVLDHATIQPYATIGNSNFIWSNAVVAHGSTVGDANWITSGVVISGDATIKSKCFLGVNATIGHNVTIEDENFIGANTLVTKSTKEKEVFISKEGEKFRLDSQRFLQFTGV